jgi:hypothetical protein
MPIQSPGLNVIPCLVIALPLALLGYYRFAVKPVGVSSTAANNILQFADAKETSIPQYPPGIVGWALRQDLDDARYLEAGSFPRGRNGQLLYGISTKRDVRRDDVVFRIPAQLLMWSHGPKFLEDCARVGPGVPPRLLEEDCAAIRNNTTCTRLRLIACLAAIKRNSSLSIWGGYVTNLPAWQNFATYHPLAADEALLDKFDQLPLVREVRTRLERREELYLRYRRLGGNVSVEDFTWADVAVSVYARGSVMVPVGDSFSMSRHGLENVVEESAPGANAGEFSLVYKATADIPMGHEIITSDASGPAADFLESWGYPTTCRTTISTVSTTTCRTNFARDPQIEPLSAKRCKELIRTVGSALTDRSKPCRPPLEEPQKATFCSLSSLVVDHCLRFY